MSSESSKPLILPLFANTVKSEWSWERLDNIAVVYDCPHSTPQLVDDYAAPYVVRSQDVRTGTILLENAARVSIPTYQERIKRVEPHFGDLVYSREGTYFGIAAEVPRGIKVCLGQRMVLIRPDASIINYTFLKYWLNSPLIFGHIHGFRDGTVAERLNLPVIRGLAVAFPTLVEQGDIAEVLSALDDRITLLRETNTTLEAIAQALFKSWFVDFDPVRAKQEGREPEGMDADTAALFPDSFEESELGLVPRGWKIGKLEDCCQRVESGGTPKRTQTAYWNGDIDWITSGEVRNPIVFESKEKITAIGVKESSAKIWPAGTTIVAMYGATAGEVCYLAKPSTANQACCGLIPLEKLRSFLFFVTRRERENLASKSSGSAQQNLNKGLVCSHQIIIPSKEVLTAYEEITGKLLNGWIENEKRAQTLTTLRDTLLPRLISGQLRLPDAEELIEEATA